MRGAIIALLIAFGAGVIGGSISLSYGDAWVVNVTLQPNSSLTTNVNITGNFTASSGALFLNNLTMTSPNGTRFNCGVNNSGGLSCN